MRINGFNGVNTQVGGMNMMQSNDSVSKNLQSQIANAQKQLQELSANKDMSIEEKMKKQQEIRQKIMELNQELRQHQIEQHRAAMCGAEKKQEKGNSMEDMLGGSKRTAPKAGNKSVGLSQASMKAIISADSAVEQARVQGNVARRMEGRAGVLESEIKLDMARGDDVEAKKEELAEIQQKATQAEAAQMNTLTDANKELEEAVKAEQRTEKTEDKKTDKKDAVSKEKEDKKVTDAEESKTVDSDVTTETVVSPHVDLRL